MLKNCELCKNDFEGHFNALYCLGCKKIRKKDINKKYNTKIKNIKNSKLENDIIEGEVWKDIIGYEGLYKISSMGRVKSSFRKGGGGILKQSLSKNGYYTVGLRKKNQGMKSMTIHRLIGLHFIDNPNNLPVIDHINRNRTDNNLNNLRWTSYSDNCINRDVNGSISIDKRTINDKTYIYYRVFYKPLNQKRISKRFKKRSDADIYLNELYEKYKR